MRPSIDAVAGAVGWVAVSAAATLIGWGLSLGGWLGAAGEALAWLAAGAIGARWAWGRRERWQMRWRPRRWCRGWPAVFFALWFLAALGGALHAPSNIDALTYRLPRVLHWLDAGRWHWLDTQHLRMNYSATGTEWLTAPVLAATRSARLLFLFNTLNFLLLPGLVFTWLRGLGVRGKVAWRWMWLTPAALGFALQAGSIANDLAGEVYFLAAMVFAQRAATGRTPGWLILSAMALGLATGVKASNLVLVPMGLVLAWPAWRALARDRARTGWVALALGAAVSCGPTLALNAVYSGHWSGDPHNLTHVQPGSVAAAGLGNGVMFALQNLAPPFFPWAGTWNAWNEASLLPWWRGHFGATSFPRFTARLAELPQEEWAGLGLLFCALLATEVWLGKTRRPTRKRGVRALLWTGAAGAFGYGAVMGSEMPARLLLPFYFVPIAAVAVGTGGDLNRSRAWRAVAAATVGVAFIAIVVNPARPLFPAQRLATWAQATWPDGALIARAARVYAVYAARPDALAEVRRELRANETVVGFLASDDDSEWSLWQPPGGRRVEHVRNLDDPRLAGVRVLVVRADVYWPDVRTEEAALARAGFRVEARKEIVVKAARPAERWLVARRL